MKEDICLQEYPLLLLMMGREPQYRVREHEVRGSARRAVRARHRVREHEAGGSARRAVRAQYRVREHEAVKARFYVN